MKAVRDALGKLEDGRSREDAEAVCGPEVLQQIFKWKVVAYPRIFQFYEVLFFWLSQASNEESSIFFLKFCVERCT